MTHGGLPFVVIFDTNEDLVGKFNGPTLIPARMERVVKFFRGKWFVGEDVNHMDFMSTCKAEVAKGEDGEEADHKICIMGLTLKYDPETGFLRLVQEDFENNKVNYGSLRHSDIGRLFAHVEWPESHVFLFKEIAGYLPCNVKWSNALRFDPSDREGKCLHFTVVSKGTVFVVFSTVPNDRDTWYYVQISPYGVGIFKVCQILACWQIQQNVSGVF